MKDILDRFWKWLKGERWYILVVLGVYTAILFTVAKEWTDVLYIFISLLVIIAVIRLAEKQAKTPKVG